MRDIVSELKEERKELRLKADRLDKAMTNYSSLGITASQANLMSSQWIAMKHYTEALDNRIKDLQKHK